MHICIRLLCITLALFASLPSMAYSADYYSKVSALAAGKWVKIDVDTTGIYEISHDQLLQWGFSDPKAVHVYGYGGVAPTVNTFENSYIDDMPASPSVHTDDNRLIFFAEGPVRASLSASGSLTITRNNYDTAGHYFLSDVPYSYSITTQEYAECPDAAERVINWHYCFDIVENEVQNPGNGGAFFHDKQLFAGDSQNFDFHIRDFGWNMPTTPFATFQYTAAVNTKRSMMFNVAFSDNIYVPEGGVNISASPTNSITTRLYNTTKGSVRIEESTDEAGKELNDSYFTATISVPSSFIGTYAAIDAAYVIYPRLNRLANVSELSMTITERDCQLQNLALENADANVQVWNVTNPMNIFAYGIKHNGDGTAAIALGDEFNNGTQRLVAFNPAAKHRTPSFGGIVSAQNIHGADTPELLIVTTTALRPYAEQLAQIHRDFGCPSFVCTQDEAFNEFGSGAKTPAAVRRVVKMFYDKNPGKLRNVLFYGCATYDFRFIEASPFDALITFECENIDQAKDEATNYCSDTYFGMVADNFNAKRIHAQPSQVATGRMPVTDAETGLLLNSIVKKQLTNLPTAAIGLRTLKFSDNEDDGIHFKNSEEVADTLLTNPNSTIFRADNMLFKIVGNRAPEASAAINNALERGVGFFYYTGHGTSGGLTAEKLWDCSRAKTVTHNYPPLALLASCDAYPLDRHRASLAEVMVSQTKGGMTGVIAACRSVYLDHNHIFSLAVAEAYANAKAGTTNGEILMLARNILIANGISGNVGYNTLCFNHCGDPAIPLSIPTYNIIIDSFGDGNITTGASTPLIARVVNENGATVNSFTGTVLIEVYDAPFTRKTLSQNKEDGPVQTTICDETILAEYPAKVVNGVIYANITLPLPAIENKTFRVVVTATDTTSGLYAAGTFAGKKLSIGNNNADTNGPQITDFSIDSESYIGDNVTGSTITLNATMTVPSCGLAVSNSGVRPGMSLIIDGKTRYANIRNVLNYGTDNNANITYTLTDQSFGKHTATLTVFDNNGNSASEIISFTVGSTAITGNLTIDEANPVRKTATFNLDSEGSAKRLIIIDSDGNTVYSTTNVSFPYTWNLRDTNDTIIPDGKYRAWAVLESDLARGASNTVEFIVVK